MTKLFFWPAMLALAISFTACSEDDNTPNSNELAGSWRMESLDYSGTSTTTTGGQTASADFDGVASDIDLTIDFSENPNQYTTSGSYKVTVTSEVNGMTFEQTQEFNGFLDNGTWERDGDIIMVTTGSGELSEATIATLNANTLILESVDSETNVTPDITTVTQVTSVITFSRE
jgi:hypothetical protein